jgi:hypothetical protein
MKRKTDSSLWRTHFLLLLPGSWTDGELMGFFHWRDSKRVAGFLVLFMVRLPEKTEGGFLFSPQAFP